MNNFKPNMNLNADPGDVKEFNFGRLLISISLPIIIFTLVYLKFFRIPGLNSILDIQIFFGKIYGGKFFILFTPVLISLLIDEFNYSLLKRFSYKNIINLLRKNLPGVFVVLITFLILNFFFSQWFVDSIWFKKIFEYIYLVTILGLVIMLYRIRNNPREIILACLFLSIFYHMTVTNIRYFFEFSSYRGMQAILVYEDAENEYVYDCKNRNLHQINFQSKKGSDADLNVSNIRNGFSNHDIRTVCERNILLSN